MAFRRAQALKPDLRSYQGVPLQLPNLFCATFIELSLDLSFLKMQLYVNSASHSGEPKTNSIIWGVLVIRTSTSIPGNSKA